jgi:hypothetical protein
MEDGFSPDDVLHGLGAIAGERWSVREAYRANPTVRRHRRRSLSVAGILVVVGVALIVITRLRAVEYEPRHYRVGTAGMVMAIASIILFGIAFMTVMRSPFRSSPGERLFRLIWLGPVGRAFVRLSARGVSREAPSQAVSRPSLTPTVPPPVVAPPSDRLAALEARLAALEKEQR